MGKEPKQLFELPDDLYGRIACVLVGLLFGVGGTWSILGLITNGRGFDAFVIYEVSGLFAVLGWLLVIWGFAAPSWLRRAMDSFAAKLVIIVGLLFIPFVFEAIAVLF